MVLTVLVLYRIRKSVIFNILKQKTQTKQACSCILKRTMSVLLMKSISSPMSGLQPEFTNNSRRNRTIILIRYNIAFACFFLNKTQQLAFVVVFLFIFMK